MARLNSNQLGELSDGVGFNTVALFESQPQAESGPLSGRAAAGHNSLQLLGHCFFLFALSLVCICRILARLERLQLTCN